MTPQLEPHVYSVITSSNVACELAELLPDCDIAEELRTILNLQHEILCEMIQGRHFGSSRIENFLSYLDDTLENTQRIKKCR
jgi:hypothetical protein